MSLIKNYYKEIINLIIEKHSYDFLNAKPGHCMKITGLGEDELLELWGKLSVDYKIMNTFVLSDNHKDDLRYISATKLIEYRNQDSTPLLILIPANSRTAAEDSYGNATFKELRIDTLDKALAGKLESKIPTEYSQLIKNEILNFLNPTLSERINYLLSLISSGFTAENIGILIYHLNYLPDSKLLSAHDKIRMRLNYNRQSIGLLSNFGKPVFERISELPIEPDSLQNELVKFLKNEKSPKTRESICKVIYEDFPDLNFAHWRIPDLNFTKMELFVDEISSTAFQDLSGRKILRAEKGKNVKIKIRISTTPKPNELSQLKNFRIFLMEVDGTAGIEVTEIRKLKCTLSPRPYREATIELDPNIMEEGSYFFRIFAEDEKGNILNTSDKYKESKIQKVFEEEKRKIESLANNDEKELRIRELESLYNYKKTHDSEDFDFLIEENAIPSGTNRRDKLSNVLQAYFAYRIDNLKNGQSMAEIPSPIENSNIWIDENKRLTSTFFIKYHNKHNYQINIPRKLRVMEELIIDNKAKFGRLDVTLNNNPTAIEAKAIVFKELHLLNKLVPEKLKNYRIQFFETIKNSTQDNKGIFEVCDIFNFIDIARNYITEYFIWLEELKRRINTVEDISVEEKIELQNLYTEIQNVDSIHIKTTLPDQQILDAILLNPLHPLRLIWFIQLYDQFSAWESATIEFAGHLEEWTKNLEPLFDGILSPENNPLILYSIDSSKGYQYAGEITYGWALYVRPPKQNGGQDTLTSVSRQVKTYLQNILNINKEIFLDSDISLNLVIRHIRNYIKQHPYTNKIIINLFNAGDAYVFANSLVELEKLGDGKGISYEVRLFKGKQSFIINGEALKNLINPEYNVSEEAEAFSQPVINRLFPKLRFSINSIDEYIENPEKYASHLSFLINPFPIRSELMKVHAKNKNFYLNGLITTPTVYVEENEKEIRWKRFIFPNHLSLPVNDFADKGVQFFGTFQSFIAGALSTQSTESVPSTELILSEKDKVLISLLHDNSDWVITFDRNLGPQIFDQPSKDGHIPFLLDYIPGEEVSGVSSYLTTRPTSEILGLLSPHFEEFGLNYKEKEDEEKIKILLEDLRAISSSLVMQLNTSKNKAFEVIGAAFTKRVLEKKKFLENAFLIPIDLHQYLFENLPTDNKSRADNLLVSFDIENRSIVFTVIEVKCRKSIAESEKIELKDKMKKQIENTISALKLHFDPYLNLSHDRLDRQIKNKELKSLLEFYVNRASRYKYLDDQVYQKYLEFLQTLDSGFQLVFKQLGLIYDFSTPVRHKKDVIDSELTYFTFGSKLIDEILDPESDLNTRRLENEELESDLRTQIGAPANLSDFLKSIGNLEVYEQPEIEKIIEEPKSEPITQPKEIVATKTEIIKNPEAEITKEKGTEIFPPRFDVLIGKSGESPQYGLLGKTIHGKTLAIDLSETNTISLFGVQGGGKSYSIGIVAEMVMKQVSNVNILPSPLASVIFHYSESMDYEPEFTSMILPNDQESEIEKLKKEYGANPESISDIVILTPKDKVSERQSRYPSIPILPIAFNSSELNVQDWMFLLGAVGNDSTYIKQLKAIMKENRNQLSIENLLRSIEDSVLLSNTQKALARQRLSFAQEYIDDSFNLKTVLKPGRLVLVDLRDEFVEKDQALGLFVIMLNIFSSVKGAHDNHFNKFIVFDEAHKYMDNKELTGSIVTAIREMRHKGVSIMIASQDPPSLPNEIIELSSIVLVHKFNSPQWLKHIQKSITQLDSLSPADMSALQPGEGFIWSTKANDKSITTRPVKIYTRPRFTKHGGGTIRAI